MRTLKTVSIQKYPILAILLILLMLQGCTGGARRKLTINIPLKPTETPTPEASPTPSLGLVIAPNAQIKPVQAFGIVSGGQISTGHGMTVIATVGEAPTGLVQIDPGRQVLQAIPNLKGSLYSH